ncbi:unnamed protein product [Tuber aestivum]|uniref:GTP cyclohydrolase N-terminal domain-containing protein n=1 Tax=Tuber aestivum TaxID=59557 RepID=A0A292PYQ0_9PEZI|nr:unnamed protein product [Tuber aestivum]
MADTLLSQILSVVTQLQQDSKTLAASVDAINGRVNALADVKKLKDDDDAAAAATAAAIKGRDGGKPAAATTTTPVAAGGAAGEATEPPASPTNDVIPTVARKPNVTSRIILTTYPGQSGIDPIIMNWGEKDTTKRGPVVVSRGASTVRRRNAIGAHGGSYSIYHALAVAIQDLKVDHKPDFTNTEPAATIGPFPQWSDPKKIVAMDPLGHLAPWLYNDYINKENVEIRPTIAITKAHMKLPELENSVKAGRLKVDGKICLNESGELAVTKFAVEPVWYLPGVAERFGIDEGTLRRSLFENTGGSFPELITRNDIKLFLPPIGGLTVYCFGDPAKMSDPNVKLALRVHDECNGSDVFGSDICTCRPYLIFGIEEAVKEAQKGGSGVVVYFRKEGRALGEVTKARESRSKYDSWCNIGKRGIDRASEYFKSMKYDAIVGQGIPIHERIPIPDEMIPEDSRVEIDAKIHAGYFTTARSKDVRGTTWITRTARVHMWPPWST